MLLAFEVPLPVVLLGTIVGVTYGLLAIGIVLVYRSNKIINFAHGEIGAFAAVVFGVAVRRWHVPYYLGLPLALALGAAVAALAEVAVVRRLRRAPKLMSIVATLGVGQFLAFFGGVVNVQGTAFSYPQPPGVPVFNLGALRITSAYSAMLFFAPALVIGLVLFLHKSGYGIGIRSAAANPEAARMAGIFAGRMSSLVWAIAGGVSAFTAILVLPSRGFIGGEAFGPSLLLRALAVAVVARMVSLPMALAGGIGLGILEQVLLWNRPGAGFVELALFGIILVGLLVQPTVTGRDEEKGSWAAVQAWRAVPDAVRHLWLVRNLGWVLGAAALGVASLLPLVVSNSSTVILCGMLGFAMVGLSVGVITGLAGQLSLGQFALAGIGATVSYHVSTRIGSFPLAFLYAGLAAALASLVIGLPALRIKGLMLTVTTLSFALVTPSWLLQQEWALGDGPNPGRPIVFGHALTSGRAYYFFALGTFVLLFLLARNIRRGGFGRLLIAVRDNEDNARAFTVSTRVVKMQAFLVAGFIAGVGGAAYGHTFSRISPGVFLTRASIDVVAMTVLGGVSILAGPLLGALYIIGVPAFLPLDAAGLAASQLGWLVLILYVPGGLAQLFQPLRDRVIGLLAQWKGIDLAQLDDGAAVDDRSIVTRIAERSNEALVRTNGHHSSRGRGALLEAVGLEKRFGGVTAVDGLSLRVNTGEILGLIGPNGAGKTTTFEILGGFTRPDAGIVRFDGEDVSGLSPEQRGRIGLIRSFQDAALFPTMTVLDTVTLAFERVAPTSLMRSMVGTGRAERQRQSQARELVSSMGLDSYRDKPIHELSTGTRRITEIACLIALRPTLLLLDEPSSGIAQRETEALGTLLAELKRQLDITMIVIEHDIPLIMALSDRIVAMDAGRVIADGPPAQVRTDQRVVDAYLGGSLAAIERSGITTNGSARPGSAGRRPRVLVAGPSPRSRSSR